ncbi:hypothetical protein DITRI_Ditri08aG0017800 [Diplodiscus trichospermus]
MIGQKVQLPMRKVSALYDTCLRMRWKAQWLSIGDRALLNKWIWRYGDEKEALWRKVIDDKYGGKELLPQVVNHRRFSGLRRIITKPMIYFNEHSETLFSSLGFSLGSGSRIDFWSCGWIPDVIVKYAFPRIFALAITKKGRSAIDIVRCLDMMVVPFKPIKNRVVLSWMEPPLGIMKFNVDGSALGKLGPVGTEGVLRDHLANKRIVFSETIGVVDSNLAELLAVTEAFIIFLSSPWPHSI